MIAVLTSDATSIVEEFFELFKTPWEFYVPGRSYDVVLTTCEAALSDVRANVVVIYGSERVKDEPEIELKSGGPSRKGRWLEWGGYEFPIYGSVSVFQAVGSPFLICKETRGVVGTNIKGHTHQIVRVGYDLFSEVDFLLSVGQPPESGHIPTLDIHVGILREIMIGAGVSFIEVPPVPIGYEFMACLTHDVDFVGIRDHVLDHTMWGFLYRCLVTSTLNACKGKMTWSNCLQNWKAALSLPLVHLGICDDFWLEFDRYMDREKGLGSTFFFIPFKNTAGKLGFSAAPGNRAAKYDVAQLQEHIRHLRKNGCEIGVHGINAWQYSQDACMELSTIREITGESEIGIRIHWLYWDGNSRNVLAEAGLSYDSTFGYNDAIGFRAGTVQAFCHLGTNNLVELPLNIQDTAMFYPDRMNLSEPEALRACKGLISWTIQFGGALTLNWHTRSLSPERLWGDFYARLLEEIQKHRVWFGTAGDIVRWFRKRRALRFDSVRVGEDFIVVSLGSDLSPSGPSLCLRIYNPRRSSATSTSSRWAVPRYVEVPWNGEEELQIPRGTGAVNQS